MELVDGPPSLSAVRTAPYAESSEAYLGDGGGRSASTTGSRKSRYDSFASPEAAQACRNSPEFTREGLAGGVRDMDPSTEESGRLWG